MRRAALLAVLLAALALPGLAVATPVQRASFGEIEKATMCISCDVPLNIAESPQADRTRVEIRRLIGRGLTKQQVLDQLVDEYGDNILATPKARGVNLFAYVVPVAAVLALVALGVALLPRWKRARDRAAAAHPAVATGPVLAPADALRLDEDLRRYDR